MKGYDRNRQIHGYLYGMTVYFEKNVQRYLRDAGEKNQKKLRKVDTPFLDESREPMGCTTPQGVGASLAPTRHERTEEMAAQQSSSTSFNKVAGGILMQFLYGARMTRADCLRGVGHLAMYLTN